VAAVYDAFGDYRPEVEELIDLGDQVLRLTIEHGTGRCSGAQVNARRNAHVWTLRDGEAVQLDLYLERDAALSAVGLAE
jgi:ketosteroid isomerase-like protein